MNHARVLMLVSDRADEALRQSVIRGDRPRPDYLYLEQAHGVTILDWSQLSRGGTRRNPALSIRHVLAAIRRRDSADVIFSDGEHLGIPLAVCLRAMHLEIPHLVIGHHLTTRLKGPLLRQRWVRAGISRLVLHSREQIERARQDLGFRDDRLAFVPYHADTEFWSSSSPPGSSLIVAAGREHRDYVTLGRACAGLTADVFIAQASRFSPTARAALPAALPAQFQVGRADYRGLRDWYARAAIVVVPLLPNDFQAGVTTILEAMAMARPVIVSATAGQRDIIEDGRTGLLVSPSDAGELRRAITFLLNHPQERVRLGANARAAVEHAFDLRPYGDRLIQHAYSIARRREVA